MAQEQIKTKEQIEKEKKDAKKAQRAAKKVAAETLKELVEKSGDKKYSEALKVIRPSLYGGSTHTSSGPRQSLTNDFLTLIVTKKSVNEDEIFKAFRIGRREAAAMIRKSLKNSEPANRIWIKFDEEKGIYSFVSKGAEPPKGWDGYIPVEEKVELK